MRITFSHIIDTIFACKKNKKIYKNLFVNINSNIIYFYMKNKGVTIKK